MSLRAYQQATARSEKPRESEYRLFGQVTRALIEASRSTVDDLQTRIDAIDWNRRLWSALAHDCAQPENQLPAPLRAQIISLSAWVRRYSSEVMRGDEDFDALIEINRIMMQGLDGKVDSPAPADFAARPRPERSEILPIMIALCFGAGVAVIAASQPKNKVLPSD